MLFRTASLVLSLTATALAQPFVESPDFDPVQALSEKGIDVSSLRLNLTPRSGESGCAVACESLTLIYGHDDVLSPASPQYANFSASYWSSIPSAARPACVFTPSNAPAVSILVLLSRITSCPFAVKSGGHAAFAGASSITGGITVSLDRLNEITLSEDHSIASVGPGNRWGTVYAALDTHNLTVIGGRAADVGVGGLTLGGGISFLSNIYGWACDNVAQYEVVTACGDILTATPTEHQDLYWALRGGGNNFGVVTRFDLYTHPLPNGTVWGGQRLYGEQAFPALINALTDITDNASSDLTIDQIVTFGVTNGTRIAAVELFSLDPSRSTAPQLANFNAITPFTSSTNSRPYADLIASVTSPAGKRDFFSTLSYTNDAAMNAFAKDTFLSLAASWPKTELLTLTLHAITVPQLQHMSARGGNALGLDPDHGAVMILLLQPIWDDVADDEAMYAAGSKVLEAIKAEAVRRGLYRGWAYMNYASRFQDVIRGYGEENKKRLGEVAGRYDPAGVWRRLVPGGFKLDGPPVGGTGNFNL
ncbi:FAD-binding domain-containing protein [Myriangium duriaei CBS 260.36]|uniref:FAD-binding domain-containing protein n=1 Tax=Myriangium duriaei CBS 260.36 TaxID=1168546 RepID=A0A9P4MF94_9PEZI|nr:FAD-binding domain-containing protein [Myriangium duriaei CBS 260.36]